MISRNTQDTNLPPNLRAAISLALGKAEDTYRADYPAYMDGEHNDYSDHMNSHTNNALVPYRGVENVVQATTVDLARVPNNLAACLFAFSTSFL